MLRWIMMAGLVAGLLVGVAQAEEADTETPAVEAGEPATPDEGTEEGAEGGAEEEGAGSEGSQPN